MARSYRNNDYGISMPPLAPLLYFHLFNSREAFSDHVYSKHALASVQDTDSPSLPFPSKQNPYSLHYVFPHSDRAGGSCD